MRLVIAALLLLPVAAQADDWSPASCGDEPAVPHYSLKTLAGYNDAVAAVKQYRADAAAYSACVLKAAGAEETRISRDARNRIDDIQTIAVGKQQEIYGRFASQGAAFKAAAARLKGK